MNEPGQMRILVVDDEEDILELVRYNLELNGFRTVGVSNGESALREIRWNRPDLVVLDLMLPHINGLEVCRILKQKPETRSILILMLTARGEERDIVEGLELGADDYVTKPFSPQILVARVKALLRRTREEGAKESAVITLPDLTIHPGKREVRVAGKAIELTYTEFQLLHHLARHPNIVFTRNQIINQIRGENYPVTDRAVDFQIVGLRKKLGIAGRYINTVRGVGYRFYVEE